MAVGSMNFLLIFQGVHSSNLRVERKFFSTEVKLVGTCFLHITLHPNLGRISSTSFRFLQPTNPEKPYQLPTNQDPLQSQQRRRTTSAVCDARFQWFHQIPIFRVRLGLESAIKGQSGQIVWGGWIFFLQNPLSEFEFGPATLVKLPRLP